MGKSRLAGLLAATLVTVAVMWGAIFGLGLSPQLGLDLRGGITTTLLPAPGQGEIDQEVLDQTVQVIRQRIDGLGVAEPEIARQGETILVQLPGLADREQAQEVIGRTAQLQFRPVLEIIPPEDPAYDQVGPSCDESLLGPPPEAEEVVLCFVAPEAPFGEDPDEFAAIDEEPVKYRLAPVAVGGVDVTDARARIDQFGRWDVSLELSSDGGQRFAQVTADLACQPPGSPLRQLAIVLDDRVESAPQVEQSVPCGVGIPGGSATITTGGGETDARQLALVLRTGALPIQLEFGTFQSVSATLGLSSLQAGLQAGLIGLVLVALYMIALYRGMGLAAVAELAMFGLVVFGAIILLGEYAGFTLTLAGIAGIIVSIGIAADSSIIYRERYRDEVRAGRTVRTAADHAFRKAWRTNLTGNTVSFLAAVVLYWLAVGPVRGFAFTLGLATLIDTILFGTFTRALFGLIARTPALAASKLVGLRAGIPEPATAGGPASGARPGAAKNDKSKRSDRVKR